MSRAPIRLRVLMSTDTVGGVWMYALELARALRPHGVQVILATMGARLSEGQRRQIQHIPDLIVRESAWRLEWMETPWRDVAQAGRWLQQLERRFQPDLIHLNHYSHGHLDWRAPHLVVGHSCVLSWWRGVFGCEAPATRWRTYRRHVRRGLAGADLVAAPSGTMLAMLESHYGPFQRTAVVHNGRAPTEFRPAEKRPCILAAGRLWDAGKNLRALADHAPSLDWPVYLAGEARHPNGGEARLAHIHALGRLAPEALARWYAQSAIYALPARYEPFGLSVLEASLAGCAPVLGDIPSLRELWDGAARFVPPDEPAALIAALNELADAPAERRELAARARERARQYSAAAMAEGYLAVYDELLGTAAAPAVPARATWG